MINFLKKYLAGIVVGSTAVGMALTSIINVYHVYYELINHSSKAEPIWFCIALTLATVGAMGVVPMISRVSDLAKWITWTGIAVVFTIEAIFNTLRVIMNVQDKSVMEALDLMTFNVFDTPETAATVFAIALGISIPLIAIGYMKSLSEMYVRRHMVDAPTLEVSETAGGFTPPTSPAKPEPAVFNDESEPVKTNSLPHVISPETEQGNVENEETPIVIIPVETKPEQVEAEPTVEEEEPPEETKKITEWIEEEEPPKVIVDPVDDADPLAPIKEKEEEPAIFEKMTMRTGKKEEPQQITKSPQRVIKTARKKKGWK